MDRNEFRRLEKAHNKMTEKNNKQALYEWGVQFERQLNEKISKAYEEKFKQDLEASVDAFMTAILYTLHFSEVTKLGPKRLQSVWEDLIATVNLFSTNEMSPEEYREELKKEKIDFIFYKDKANEKKSCNEGE